MNHERATRILTAHHATMRTVLDMQDTAENGRGFSYPNGQCLSSCLLMIPLLRVSEPDAFVIEIGRVGVGGSSGMHVWIKTTGYVIDPTIGQFHFWQRAEPYAIMTDYFASQWMYHRNRELTLHEEDDLRLETYIDKFANGARVLRTKKISELWRA